VGVCQEPYKGTFIQEFVLWGIGILKARLQAMVSVPTAVVEFLWQLLF
jgi:hypothetical protein